MYIGASREQLYYKICLIRRFEERLLEMYSEGLLMGTMHACIGQEANAVAVIGHLDENDIVVSNHRCHGHYIEHTGDVTGLMAEVCWSLRWTWRKPTFMQRQFLYQRGVGEYCSHCGRHGLCRKNKGDRCNNGFIYG